ncbi:MAG: sortase, partial [Frankiales bacterium]|nr:sortase [Frankiales bacterium]
MVAANVLAGLALVVGLFAAYLVGVSGVIERRSQHQLAAQLAGRAGLDAFGGRLPAQGQPVAVVEAPSIGLHALVVEGTSSADLEKGPGLMVGSAPPGTGGDTVIMGRRATFGAPFARLSSLRAGDSIQLVAALGRFTYDVTSVSELSPGAPDPITSAPEGRLTLVTSAPSWFPTRSLVVQARLVGAPVAADPSVPPPNPSLGLAGDSGSAFGVLLSGELFLALVIGMFVWRRRRAAAGGLTRMAWVLAFPLGLMLLLVLFS